MVKFDYECSGWATKANTRCYDGLTIAQELARLHHGEILLESEVGKGSCFTLKLPLLAD